jgi:hypothetical protein
MNNYANGNYVNSMQWREGVKMGLISDAVMEYADLCYGDDNQRYRSWEHCYGYFRGRQSFKTDADIDIAALHLGFYLAS